MTSRTKDDESVLFKPLSMWGPDLLRLHRTLCVPHSHWEWGVWLSVPQLGPRGPFPLRPHQAACSAGLGSLCRGRPATYQGMPSGGGEPSVPALPSQH